MAKSGKGEDHAGQKFILSQMKKYISFDRDLVKNNERFIGLDCYVIYNVARCKIVYLVSSEVEIVL